MLIPGSYIKYIVRQSHHARNPETRTPKISPTAERCPSDAILPSAVNANLAFGAPLKVATRFSEGAAPVGWRVGPSVGTAPRSPGQRQRRSRQGPTPQGSLGLPGG